MVSFELSEEQKMVRETLNGFARERIRPAARAADESGIIPAELIAESWPLGLVTGVLPERFGGGGDKRSALTGAVVGEELAWADLSIAIHMLAPRLLAYPVLEMGTEEQRASYLKPLAGPQFVPLTAAMMEPRYDFDPHSLQTRAQRDGTSFVLNGAKSFVPLAEESQSILVYAASQGREEFGGLDAFLVGRNADGLRLLEREKNMGLKGLATYELALEHCRVGAEARLGGEAGIDAARLLSEQRVAIVAMAVGVARAAFEYARDYAKERRAFGAPIATKQAIAFMLAEMAIEIDASRLLLWEAAWRLDKGAPAYKESYLAKNYVAAASLKVADNALQVLGGHGYIRDHPVELWLRNARGFAAFEGLAIV